MADELRGVELRLERAHEHIHALNHEARMFMLSLPPPYGMTIDDEPEGKEYIVRAKIDRLPSIRLGMIVADAVHNLRAALDMIAWELALKGPEPPPEDDRSVAFPICTHPDAWNSNTTKRMIERVPDYARQIIKSFQPCYRPILAGRRLELIQAIDNWGKHKAIPNLFSFHISRIRYESPFEMISFTPGALDHGDEMCRIVGPDGLDPKEHFKPHLMVHVGFAKHGPAQGAPIDFLENTYEEIRDTVLPAFQPFFES